MSRIGRKPISIPAGVKIELAGSHMTVTGPKGSLDRELHPEMQISIEENVINVKRPSDNKEHRSLHGLTRTLVDNMVVGVTKGFQTDLEIVGTGYKAAVQGTKLVLSVGHSHPVEIAPPAGITFETPTPVKIAVKGSNKEIVGQMAADIRAKRPPEIYHGTGIRYAGEVVHLKAGKTGKVGK